MSEKRVVFVSLKSEGSSNATTSALITRRKRALGVDVENDTWESFVEAVASRLQIVRKGRRMRMRRIRIKRATSGVEVQSVEELMDVVTIVKPTT